MSGWAAALEVPAGVHALTAARHPIPAEVLVHGAVSTVVVRGDWSDFEPEEGRYDWRYLDEQFGRIARAGKSISLVVTTGGRQVPGWLKPKLGAPFEFIDQVRYHASFGQTVSIPVFWDPELLAHKRRFTAALGERYSSNPALKLVSVQCANATTDDWNIPATPDDVVRWRRLGFTSERLMEACQSMIDATATAFPAQVVRMAIGRLPPGLAGSSPADADAFVRDLIRQARARWPGRFLVQRHNLSARTPGPADPRPSGWRVVADACPSCAAQFLWPVVDTRTCRANGGQAPCEARAMFSASVDVALAYRLRYVEVYASDLRETSLRDEVDRLARGLDASGSPAGAALPPEPRATGTASPASSAPRPPMVELPAPRPPAPSAGPRSDSSGIRHLSFHSAAYQGERPFSLWTPPSYRAALAAASEPASAAGPAAPRRYPVLYWLHGKGGDARRSTQVVRYFEQAINEGRLPELFIVFPDGDNDRFYTDGVDGRSPVERMIIEDLIPHVDRQYPTIADRTGRLLEGFSMGGFGALKLAAKYPERFASVVAYGAPRLTADLGMGGNDADIYREVFGADPERFRQNTPGWLFRTNLGRIQAAGLRVRLVAGGEDGTRHSVRRLHDELVALGVPHEFVEWPQVRHAPGLYYDAERGAGMDFQARSLPARR